MAAGWLGSSGLEQEEEDQETPTFVKHPTLGIGRVVSAELAFETEPEEEIIGTDERVIVGDTKKAPYRWVCCLDLYFEDPDSKKTLQLYRGWER